MGAAAAVLWCLGATVLREDRAETCEHYSASPACTTDEMLDSMLERAL